MRTINVRQLQRHFYTEIKHLPMIVTRHKQPIMVIWAFTPEDTPIEPHLVPPDKKSPQKSPLDTSNREEKALKQPNFGVESTEPLKNI